MRKNKASDNAYMREYYKRYLKERPEKAALFNLQAALNRVMRNPNAIPEAMNKINTFMESAKSCEYAGDTTGKDG